MKLATIYSYSVVYITSEEFKDLVPYVVAILEDEGNKRFPARINGFSEGKKIDIGQQVAFYSSDGRGHCVYTF